jgi:hypothetical protein
MTSLDQTRRERARNGSRRQRDRDAMQANQPNWDAYIAEHFTGENYGYALSASHRIYLADPPRDRKLPEPDAVREYMRAKGWLREQLEAEPCR